MREDYAMRCYDCERIYAPLSKSKAVELAVGHTDKQEHTDAQAVPFGELLPLIGDYKPSSVSNE